MRVLNATAAKIPWTTSPKLSFNRQFRSLEAISVVNDWNAPSTSELPDDTGVEDVEDWFIG